MSTAGYPGQEQTIMQRTWYRRQSDGTFFRNTGLVRLDQDRLASKILPHRRAALSREWEAIFRAGVTETSTLPRGDRYIDYDDSPEATEAWTRQFLARYGPRS